MLGWTLIIVGTLCVGLFSLVVKYGYDMVAEQKEEQKKQAAKSQLVEPTFSRDVKNVRVSYGGVHAFGANREQLINGSATPLSFNGGTYAPVRLWLKEDKLKLDSDLYDPAGNLLVSIKQNKLTEVPSGWDYNMNEKALEVVTGAGTPMLQLIFRADDHVVLNGYFHVPGTNEVVLCQEEGISVGKTNSQPPPEKIYNVRRIFKYPAWKYPGQYE